MSLIPGLRTTCSTQATAQDDRYRVAWVERVVRNPRLWLRMTGRQEFIQTTKKVLPITPSFHGKLL